MTFVNCRLDVPQPKKIPTFLTKICGFPNISYCRKSSMYIVIALLTAEHKACWCWLRWLLTGTKLSFSFRGISTYGERVIVEAGFKLPNILRGKEKVRRSCCSKRCGTHNSRGAQLRPVNCRYQECVNIRHPICLFI